MLFQSLSQAQKKKKKKNWLHDPDGVWRDLVHSFEFFEKDGVIVWEVVSLREEIISILFIFFFFFFCRLY